MKFEKIQPGMCVYDMGRQKMGNTTISTIAVWPVYIVSVDPNTRKVVARWNGNAERTYTERTWSKWKEKEPILVKTAFGSKRLPTPDERVAIKAERESRENDRGPKV